MKGELTATTESVPAVGATTAPATCSFLVWAFPRAGAAPVALPEPGAPEVVLGRESGCEVVLEGADVSRRHVAITWEGGQAGNGGDLTGRGGLVARDLESRNGLWVNGVRVREAKLAEQDVLRLGGWVGVLARAAAPFREIVRGLWGSARLQEALAPLVRAAPSTLPIILEGETGTGKELIARGIHEQSGRRGPFVAVNCGALPEALAESELFGHRRGAFTGAERPAAGLFRSADQGTLLLDEISDLPAGVQTKLLRVLEEGAVQPLGEARSVPVDVRVVAAGQQPLRQAIAAGRFRADLLARLDGLTLRLPPLRERREDVVPLFRLALGLAGIAPVLEAELAEALCRHDWPFNVRELVFLSRRLATLHGLEPRWGAALLPPAMSKSAGDGGGALPAVHSASAVQSASGASASAAAPLSLPAVLTALRTAAGNVARAAAMLGISRQRLYRFMEASEVDLEAVRGQQDER